MTTKKVPRHGVWQIDNYEVKVVDGVKKVECQACTKQGHRKYDYSSGTTNMANHLKNRHPELYKEMMIKQTAMKNQGIRT